MKRLPFGSRDPHAEIEMVAATQAVLPHHTPADWMPVAAARVSHAANEKTGHDPEADRKLMGFLARHRHMTPFEHQSVTFRVVAPLFVFREWHRHRTQAYNEISMRYTSDPVGKLYRPQEWRVQKGKDKQSSAGTLDEHKAGKADQLLRDAYAVALDSYSELIALGVAREQARIVVPVGNYSEMYATANLRNWAAFCALRCASSAQWEIRQYADAINDMLVQLWPDAWGVLVKHIVNPCGE